MAHQKFISYANLSQWLMSLAGRSRLLVPRREGGGIVFRTFSPGDAIESIPDATASPKSAIFPPSGELFRFEQAKYGENLESTDLKLVPEKESGPEPTIVFCARPCGVGGFAILDRIYRKGKYPDPYYTAAREKTLFITLACEKPENTCFCHWVGGGPGDPTGSDILITPIKEGYYLEAFTPSGEALLVDSSIRDAGDTLQEALFIQERSRKMLGDAPDIATVSESFLALFDDMEFWEDVSAKCLSCGACTYLCPTCYCFNITDESNGVSGRRLRSWDTCMSFGFCLEASGHTPRPTKAHRLRNRIGHKFSYFPSLNKGLIACRGCGRCIKHCPVSLDIRSIVLRVIEHGAHRIKKVSNG